MFALFYTFLYINDVKKRILAKPQRSSLKIHLCASERSERAIFGVFNSFTVKKVSFFTINVKFKVILSSKSVGGGDVCTGHPPPPKKVGEYTPPPRIYASDHLTSHISHICCCVVRHFRTGPPGRWRIVRAAKCMQPSVAVARVCARGRSERRSLKFTANHTHAAEKKQNKTN